MMDVPFGSVLLTWLEPNSGPSFWWYLTHGNRLEALEWTSAVLNLAFTAAIAYEKRWGWLLGLVASLIGVFLYGLKHTWALSALNAYYVVMGVYGWWSWGRGQDAARYHHRSWRFHVPLIAIGFLVAFAAAWGSGTVFDGAHPQADAFIMVFSFAATWMMARKVVENWVYFIVADLVAARLSWEIGYPVYAAQYLIYVGLSVAGYRQWSLALRKQADEAPSRPA